MLAHGRIGEKIQNYDCVHVGKEVKIKSQIVYPIGFLRGDAPRIKSRHCNQFADCHLLDKNACPMGLIYLPTLT